MSTITIKKNYQSEMSIMSIKKFQKEVLEQEFFNDVRLVVEKIKLVIANSHFSLNKHHKEADITQLSRTIVW